MTIKTETDSSPKPPTADVGSPRPRDLKEIALEYCRTHPEARASIIAAGRRLEEKESQQTEKPHRFTGGAPWARCIHCEATREAATAPECARYQSPADICAVIRKEEELFAKTLVRAQKIATTLNVETVTGEELAHIHHTHGVDPSMIEAALGHVLPERLAYEYAEAYAHHKATGKRGLKREVIVAKTAESSLANVASQTRPAEPL
jgi:hypothetical protein